MRHPLDGNAIAVDAHHDRPDPIGCEEGETCGPLKPDQMFNTRPASNSRP